MEKDTIVDIPENRVKFFGTHGKMLLPSADTIKSALEKIPEGKIITTTLLRNALSRQFQVEATCPVTTKKALATIAGDTNLTAPYWRVINQNGNVISNLANNVEMLSGEGFVIEAKKVKDYKTHLIDLS